jgi:hypothetical protein
VSKILWQEAYEHLEDILGREPTEKEINDHISYRHDHLFEEYKDEVERTYEKTD